MGSTIVYNIAKMLKENGDKVSGSDKTDVESALSDARRHREFFRIWKKAGKLTAASHSW